MVATNERTDHAIGYVESSYATFHHLPAARVGNAAYAPLPDQLRARVAAAVQARKCPVSRRLTGHLVVRGQPAVSRSCFARSGQLATPGAERRPAAVMAARRAEASESAT